MMISSNRSKYSVTYKFASIDPTAQIFYWSGLLTISHGIIFIIIILRVAEISRICKNVITRFRIKKDLAGIQSVVHGHHHLSNPASDKSGWPHAIRIFERRCDKKAISFRKQVSLWNLFWLQQRVVVVMVVWMVGADCRVFRVVTGSRHDMEMRRPTSAYR